ncbi:DEAD/DEAH box helicase [Neomicrococcus lactis]|uniref:DEAD/DEAH box helicase n=1 Tax=Neomicrococcus lactis TaxID=732241 RepID=UPI0022FFF528|nr:SNF2-related protein [Neomicrococcus lactis]
MTGSEEGPLGVGSFVRLLARPTLSGPIVSVDRIGVNIRYAVFHSESVHHYFDSQIEPLDVSTTDKVVGATELNAALTATLVLDSNSAYLHARNAGRVDFEPYQYRPVLKLVQSTRPRILIADDVGVGKTIEACLILKELEARKRAESVLVICPRPLVVDHKWRNELKRFDEDFAHLDSKTLRWCLEETLREGTWPARYRKAIIPYSLLDESLLTGRRKGKTSKAANLSDLAGDLKFDLIVVDEAHHVRNRETKAYQCVQRFVDSAEAVVMLSATPIQTHSQDLFTLVNLLRDDLVLDWADFQEMLRPNQYLHEASKAARNAGPGWEESVRTSLELAFQTVWGKDVLADDPRSVELVSRLKHTQIRDDERVQIIRSIESLNTFSEIVTRTRRRDIGEFTTRKPAAPIVEFTSKQQNVYDAVIALGEKIASTRSPNIPVKFLMSTLYRQAASSISGLAPLIDDIFENRLRISEMLTEDEDYELTAEQIQSLRAEVLEIKRLAEGIIEDADPKAETLRRIIVDKSMDSNNKVLVFTTFRHTIQYLERLCLRWGLRVGIMHGGVPDEDRQSIRHRFKLDRAIPDALDVMLCSEVGTEGLDYQFCNTLVNYDIPWNPMRIEQRIGRIDRRGQMNESVAIINILTQGTIEAEIYERCLSRIGVFNRAIGGSEEILGEISTAIVDIATNLKLTAEERSAALRQLSDNGIARVQEEQQFEDQQSDLLGFAGQSFRENVAEASSAWLGDTKIASLVRSYLETLVPGRTIALRPGRVARMPLSADTSARLLHELEAHRIDAHRLKRRLRRERPVISLTTDPELANEDEEIELLSPTHPLVHLASLHFSSRACLSSSMKVMSGLVSPGTYLIGVYAWTRLGARDALTLRFISENTAIEEHAAELLSSAVQGDESLANSKDAVLVDERHAAMWAQERAKHIDQQTSFIERRVAALKSQKMRRLMAISRQIESASHADIRTMKVGEYKAAEASFDGLITIQEQAANRLDLTVRNLANIQLQVIAP